MEKISLSEEEIEEYSRQISLSDIGFEGQEKIKNARIALIGLGGLGSPSSILLASMGIGYLRIVDKDVVSRSDLHRQPLYTRKDIGIPKVEVAKKRLEEINPRMKIDAIAEPLNEDNVYEIIKDVDLILDGLDNLRTRYIINRASQELKKPYVFASAIEMQGNVTCIIPKETPCLECFYGGIYNEDDLPKCAIVGVHPSVTFTVSSIAVSEAIRIIMGHEPVLKNRLLYIDLRNMDFALLNLKKNENCNVCGPNRKIEAISLDEFEVGCGRDGSGIYFVNKILKGIDLEEAKERATKEGWLLVKESELSKSFRIREGFEVTLLKSGTLIAKVKIFDPNLKNEILEIHNKLIRK